MSNIKVSLIASSIRPQFYDTFFKTLENTSVEYEVVFSGDNQQANNDLRCKYILTNNIKPAQCYEIARRNAIGETILWVADDCEFMGDIIGKAYRFWKEQNNKKLVLSLLTIFKCL